MSSGSSVVARRRADEVPVGTCLFVTSREKLGLLREVGETFGLYSRHNEVFIVVEVRSPFSFRLERWLILQRWPEIVGAHINWWWWVAGMDDSPITIEEI